MSPEVMCRKNHGFSSDYFALGVIIHECMMGKRPYNGKTRKDIREQIFAKQVQVRLEQAPKWSKEGIDFVNKVLSDFQQF